MKKINLIFIGRTVYDYFGFCFAFYSNEHRPIHLHVSKQDRESKLELCFTNKGLELTAKKVKGHSPLTSKEIKEVKSFIIKYHLDIVQKWEQVFDLGNKVTCESIKERV